MSEIAVPVTALYTGTTLATCSHKIIMIQIKFFLLLTIICLNFFLFTESKKYIDSKFFHSPAQEENQSRTSHSLISRLSPCKCYHNIILYKMFTYCKLIRGWELINFSPFSASVVCLFCNKTINANNNQHFNIIRCLFKAGNLLTFSAFRMGTYSRWALIRGWALI